MQRAEITNQEFETCFGERTKCGSRTQQVQDMSTQIYGLNQRCSANDGRHASQCAREVVRNRIVVSHTHAHTCFTQFTSVEYHGARRNQAM